MSHFGWTAGWFGLLTCIGDRSPRWCEPQCRRRRGLQCAVAEVRLVEGLLLPPCTERACGSGNYEVTLTRSLGGSPLFMRGNLRLLGHCRGVREPGVGALVVCSERA